MTNLKKAIFLVKYITGAKYNVSGADVYGNRAIDVKRRERLALPHNEIHF
jgi:hypothetical protein